MQLETSTLRPSPPFRLESRGSRQRPARSLSGWSRRRARDIAEAVLPRSVVTWRGRVGEGKTRGGGQVALTFDDGPTSLTPHYLAVLEHFSVRATFFLVGELCARYPELVQAIARNGHELAGHGYTHRRFPSLAPRALSLELEQTRRLLAPYESGHAIVRPPHGAISVGSTLVTAAAGYRTVLWSYDSGDWATKEASDVAERFTERPVTRGDIVLMHEGQTWTLEALPRVLETLRGADHELVTTSELLGG